MLISNLFKNSNYGNSLFTVGANDDGYCLKFRNSGDTDTELKEKIEKLFAAAKSKWEGIFTDSDRILLTPSHLAICVASLQDIKLFNNNLDVVDDAFEYLMNKSQKGEKGQFFTPRYVIDMCVKMMNPQEHENIIDTAAGTSGFPVHSIFHVQLTERELAFVRNHVFAIDFDEKSAHVAKTLNLIAGDGESNVIHLNTLDYGRWDEVTGEENWNDTYNKGFSRLKKIRPNGKISKDFSQCISIQIKNSPVNRRQNYRKKVVRFSIYSSTKPRNSQSG